MLIFTVENISAMEEGPEIDTLIGETITKFPPEIKFLATDASGKKSIIFLTVKRMPINGIITS